jgi:hypothetical protein
MFYFEKFAEKAFIVYGHGTRTGEDDSAVFAVVTTFPLSTNKGKNSAYYTERRKSWCEGTKFAIATVLFTIFVPIFEEISKDCVTALTALISTEEGIL